MLPPQHTTAPVAARARVGSTSGDRGSVPLVPFTDAGGAMGLAPPQPPSAPAPAAPGAGTVLAAAAEGGARRDRRRGARPAGHRARWCALPFDPAAPTGDADDGPSRPNRAAVRETRFDCGEGPARWRRLPL